MRINTIYLLVKTCRRKIFGTGCLAAFFILFVPATTNPLYAQQFSFEYDPTIPLIKGTDTLSNAWAGGLNAGQFSTIFLNEDNLEDLVVFDRTTNKISTFLAKQKGNNFYYQHAIAYENQFPDDLQEWVLLVDYNKDGKKDIFTHSKLGVKVFQNISTLNTLSWKPVADPLATKGTSSLINLQVYLTDIPAITDLDNDGDIDILTTDATGNVIEYHQNQSIDTYNHADSLIFNRVNSCWGKLQQGTYCGEYIFGIDCGSTTGKIKSPLRINHTGSSTLLVLDLDGDGDKDLLNGHLGCNSIIKLTNGGSVQQTLFTAADATFPASKPLHVPEFPASFYEDLDFDTIKDLIASPNVSVNQVDSIDFTHSNWFYKNIGTNESPVFEFRQNDFLQSTMLDVGENAFPALADYDADGDIDLFIGNRGNYDKMKDNAYASMYLYENIGTPEKATFKLKTDDYLNLSSLHLRVIKPFFTDINGDNTTDLLYTTINSVQYIPNTASQNQAFQFSANSIQSLPLPLFDNDTPVFYDTDGDNDLDALIGKASGNLEYYINTGSAHSPIYTLKSNTITTVPAEAFALNLIASIADWDGNGKVDLITGDKTGQLKMYPDLVDKLQLSPVVLESVDIDWNIAGNSLQALQLGSFIFPAAADLNNDHLPELIIGTRAGGIVICKNKAITDPNGIEDMKDVGRIYPNPANRYVYLNLLKESEVALFSVLSQNLIIRQHILANQEVALDLKNIPAGIYFLKISTGKSSVSRKIVLYN